MGITPNDRRASGGRAISQRHKAETNGGTNTTEDRAKDQRGEQLINSPRPRPLQIAPAASGHRPRDLVKVGGRENRAEPPWPLVLHPP